MARWNATLDIQDEWLKSQRDGEPVSPETVRGLAKVISERLSNLTVSEEQKENKTYFVDEFHTMSVDDDADQEGFNILWDEFYDWCDRDSVRIWIKTLV